MKVLKEWCDRGFRIPRAHHVSAKAVEVLTIGRYKETTDLARAVDNDRCFERSNVRFQSLVCASALYFAPYSPLRRQKLSSVRRFEPPMLLFTLLQSCRLFSGWARRRENDITERETRRTQQYEREETINCSLYSHTAAAASRCP
jgi:hypothetical protein